MWLRTAIVKIAFGQLDADHAGSGVVVGESLVGPELRDFRGLNYVALERLQSAVGLYLADVYPGPATGWGGQSSGLATGDIVFTVSFDQGHFGIQDRSGSRRHFHVHCDSVILMRAKLIAFISVCDAELGFVGSAVGISDDLPHDRRLLIPQGTCVCVLRRLSLDEDLPFEDCAQAVIREWPLGCSSWTAIADLRQFGPTAVALTH